MRQLFDLVILSAWIVACAPAPSEQVRYLQTAIHSATQDQVAQRLGAPERTVALRMAAACGPTAISPLDLPLRWELYSQVTCRGVHVNLRCQAYSAQVDPAVL